MDIEIVKECRNCPMAIHEFSDCGHPKATKDTIYEQHGGIGENCPLVLSPIMIAIEGGYQNGV